MTTPTWTKLAAWMPPSAHRPARVPERIEVRSSRKASTPGVRITTTQAIRKAGI